MPERKIYIAIFIINFLLPAQYILGQKAIMGISESRHFSYEQIDLEGLPYEKSNVVGSGEDSNNRIPKIHQKDFGYFIQTDSENWVSRGIGPIKDVKSLPHEDQIWISYKIPFSLYNTYYEIQVFYSEDRGETFKGPLDGVTGDVGDSIHGSGHKLIKWDLQEGKPMVDDEASFIVKARAYSIDIPPKQYLAYNGSLSAPIGIRWGKAGMPGYYLSLRITPGAFNGSDYSMTDSTLDAYNKNAYYYYNGNRNKRRISVIAGSSIHATARLHVYAGIGAALYETQWEIDEYDYNDRAIGSSWVKDPDASFFGLEVETGIMAFLGSSYIGIGLSSPNFEFIEPNISLGLSF